MRLHSPELECGNGLTKQGQFQTQGHLPPFTRLCLQKAIEPPFAVQQLWILMKTPCMNPQSYLEVLQIA